MDTARRLRFMMYEAETYRSVLDTIRGDERYLTNVAWGRPRKGHPEGTIQAHIDELEENLSLLAPRLDPVEVAVIDLLIHVHDTFKPEAKPGVPIAHPSSHASLARAYVEEQLHDPDLLAMLQWHDEPFALWRRWKSGRCVDERLEALMDSIEDWDVFTAFLLCDGCTDGKSTEPLSWFLLLDPGPTSSRFGVDDLRLLV